MAWEKSGWSDIIGTDGSKSTITSGSSANGDLDCNNTSTGNNPFITAVWKVVIVFGSTPDDNCTVEWFGKDVDDANELDTLALMTATVPEQTSSEERATYLLDVSAFDTINIKVTNNDSTDSVTCWVEAQGGYMA
jgi:hypothetical protein